MKSTIALSLLLSIGPSMASNIQTYDGSECEDGLTLTGVTSLKTENLFPCTRFRTHEGSDTVITCSGANSKVLSLIKISYSGTQLTLDLTPGYSIMNNGLQIQPDIVKPPVIGSDRMAQLLKIANMMGGKTTAPVGVNCAQTNYNSFCFMSGNTVGGSVYVNGIEQVTLDKNMIGGSVHVNGSQSMSVSNSESYDISLLKIEVTLPQTLYQINVAGTSNVEVFGPLSAMGSACTNGAGSLTLNQVTTSNTVLNIDTNSSGNISIAQLNGSGNVELKTHGKGGISVNRADLSGLTTLMTEDDGNIEIESGSLNDLDTTTSSSGDITCRAKIKGNLTYRINGSGDIMTTQPTVGTPTGTSRSSGRFEIIK